MELRDYVAILRARWITVSVTVVLAVVAALIYSLQAAPVYVARASVFFSVSVGQSTGELSRGFSYAQGLAALYSRVATQPVVLAQVITDLGLRTTPSELARKVVAQTPQGTVLIQISVSESDPQLAAMIANAVTLELTAAVGELSPKSTTATTTQMVKLTTVSPAAVPATPSGPRKTQNVLLALGVGLLAGAALALIRDALDSRVTRREVGRVTEAPVIGTLGLSDEISRVRLPGRRSAASDQSVQARQLRTNFEHLRAHRALRSVVFTSAVDDGATSSTISSLAQSLSQAGVNLLLLDADLRQPSLARRFGVDETRGLTSVLTGKLSWQAAVERIGEGSLSLLAAGTPLDDPSVMLSADTMAGLIKEVLDSYDLVMVKAPPVLRVAEGMLLSRAVDGVVLVANEHSMNRESLTEAVEALEIVGAELLGIVLSA